ncbi:Macrolide transporter ATP-binding /permease protein [Candidatus Sulfopaludibacter sp. SbA4]|nr:Macrolide transporter ATP-binding /permease protein [Candidatus Sulfopaludibacter sp. SbA4]
MSLASDASFGLRTLRRSPWFTLVAVLTLALGIGANTALFSVVDAVLLRSFGYADPGRLVQISGTSKGQSSAVSVPDFRAFQTRAHSFGQIATSQLQTFTLMGPREPENLWGQLVSPECFAVLGAVPLMGRTLAAGDFESGAPPAAVLSYKLWQTSFAADPQVVGRRVLMNGEEYSIAGVMGPEFVFPHPVFKVWAPWRFTPAELANHGRHGFTLIARLKPKVSREAAQAELVALSQSIAREFPDSNTGWQAIIQPINEQVVGNLRPVLFTLLGAVGFVLLIACLNVSNLAMGRAIERSREMAVRAALGADRIRLVRQLLTESLLIAAAGGALGLLFARGWLSGLLAMLPSRTVSILPGADRASIDSRVLAVSIAASVMAAVVSGLLPAILASRPNLEESLKEGGRAASGGLRRRRLLGGLITLEVALSVVLLAGAGLLIRSFSNLMEVRLGFRPEHVLTLQIPSPWTDNAQQNDAAKTERKMQFFSDVVHRVEAVPGVGAAGLTTVLPLGVVQIQTRIFLEGRPSGGLEGGPRGDFRVPYRAVSPNYFRAMGIPMLRGRAFTDDDRSGRDRVAIVSEAMARRFWPGEEAVGKRLTLNNPATGPWMTVVGVAGGVRHDKLASEPDPELYTSYIQTLLAPQVAVVVVRTAMDPVQLVPPVRAAIREINRNQPIADVKTMSQVVSEAVATPRLYTVLLAIFAGLALVLAAAGIFSVISWTVSQSTHEIGIRMALGARPRDVLGALMGRAMFDVLAGAVVGLGGAAALTRLLKAQLYGVTATDPATFLAVPAVLAAVAWMAAYIPARRATLIDPMAALRSE